MITNLSVSLTQLELRETLETRLQSAEFVCEVLTRQDGKTSLGRAVVVTQEPEIGKSLLELEDSMLDGNQIRILTTLGESSQEIRKWLIIQLKNRKKLRRPARPVRRTVEQIVTLMEQLLGPFVFTIQTTADSDSEQPQILATLRNKGLQVEQRPITASRGQARSHTYYTYDRQTAKQIIALDETQGPGGKMEVTPSPMKYGLIKTDNTEAARENPNSCCICLKTSKQMRQLSCGHVICANLTCLRGQMTTFRSMYSQHVKCKVCESSLDRDVLAESVGGEGALRRLENVQYCQYCFCELDESSVFLGCNHGFHRGTSFDTDCFQQLVKQYVDDSKVQTDDLICPNSECSQTIPDDVITEHLPQALRSRLLQLRENEIKRLQVSGLSQQVDRFESPHVELSTPEKQADAPKESHKPVKMPNRIKSFRREEIEEEFQKAKKDLNLKNCPVCSTAIQRVEGCNFMTCKNLATCNKKTFFCWLCEVQLTKDEEFSHFYNSPYGNTCKNLNPKPKKPKKQSVPVPTAAARPQVNVINITEPPAPAKAKPKTKPKQNDTYSQIQKLLKQTQAKTGKAGQLLEEAGQSSSKNR